MLTFKQFFPTWEDFKKFLIEFSIYYDAEIYTDQKVLIYYTLLYRNFGNSHTAFDNEVFLEQLSLTVAENFREFFQVRELLDLVASKEAEELLLGVETITNIAENPDKTTDKDSVVDYIGTQNRSRSRENIVDRVYTLVRRLRISEIRDEVKRYNFLFRKIISKTVVYYEVEEDET